MKKIDLLIIAFVMIFLGISWSGEAAAGTHLDVWLKNERGDRISPGRNDSDPYSPRKTCGVCHNYSVINIGYHFQQGFDKINDRFDARRRWHLSPGMFGRWLPTAAAARLAAKKNTDLRQIDLSTYDWIGGGKYEGKSKVAAVACGWCHPGGGPMEYGRDAGGRADLTRNLAAGEKHSKEKFDGDYSSLWTPDGKSRFRESGVVEADCLLCHKPDYGLRERNEQLNRRNYRWAATAGAGLGRISGAVFTYSRPGAGPSDPGFREGTWNLSKRPVTAYRWTDRRLFAPEGRLRGQVIRKHVADRNCLQCHGEGEAKNTGGRHDPEFDAHLRAGMTCTDCHPLAGKSSSERLRHQIAKGNSTLNTVRDDLDEMGMRTCVGCHGGGRYAAPLSRTSREARNPQKKHLAKFAKASFHTYLISCGGCHSVAQPGRGMAVLDMSAGQETGYTADNLEGVRWLPDYDRPAKEPWKPWLARLGKQGDAGEQYTPVVPKHLQWFGERQAGGEIRPIPLRYVAQAVKAVPGLSVLTVGLPGGDKGKRWTVVKDDDIIKMSRQLTGLGFREVVFVSDRVYQAGTQGLKATPLPGPPVMYGVEHGVIPLAKQQAYGTKGAGEGCGDCHSDTASFFNKMTIKNLRGMLKDDYPQLKDPNAVPQYESWGLKGTPSYE